MTYAKITAIRGELKQVVKERDDAVDAVIVALIAQDHILLIGPPGDGKSFLANAAVQRITDCPTFEMDLSPSTTPEDVFGPLDVKAYVEEGKYRQVLSEGLAAAVVAVIDELFNVNPVTGDKMYPALNERRYKVGGRMLPIPLQTMIGGTNKIITNEPEYLAFWDRVGLRVVVDYIQDPDTRLQMSLESLARRASHGNRADARTPGIGFTTVSLPELQQATKESLALTIPVRVMEGFRDLSQDLRSQGIVLSDRRVANAWPIVQANAWMNGHDEVWLSDLDILVHSWWTDMESKAKSFSIITEAVNPILGEIMTLQRDLSGFKSEFAALEGEDDALHRRNALQNVMKNVAQATAKVTALGDDTRAKKLADEYEAFKQKCLSAYQATLGF